MHRRTGGPWDLVSLASMGQGIFYAISGLWPLLSMRTFTWVTGPKVDLWLVRTVGALLSVIGLSLTLAGLRRRVTASVQVLGAGCPLVLMVIDTIYVSRRRIRRVYLLDAVAEAGIIAVWGLAILTRERLPARGGTPPHIEPHAPDPPPGPPDAAAG